MWKNKRQMTKTDIKKQIHKAVDIVDSDQLLKAIYMLLNEEVKNKKEAIQPFTLEEFYGRNAQSQKEIKQGKLAVHKSVTIKYGGK